MAQGLRVSAALVEDLGLAPSTNMAVHNHPQLQFQKMFPVVTSASPCMQSAQTHLQAKHSQNKMITSNKVKKKS